MAQPHAAFVTNALVGRSALTAIARRLNRENLTGRTTGWKQIRETLTIHCGDRLAV